MFSTVVLQGLGRLSSVFCLVLAATKVQNFDDINEAIVENLKKNDGLFRFCYFCRFVPLSKNAETTLDFGHWTFRI